MEDNGGALKKDQNKDKQAVSGVKKRSFQKRSSYTNWQIYLFLYQPDKSYDFNSISLCQTEGSVSKQSLFQC